MRNFWKKIYLILTIPWILSIGILTLTNRKAYSAWGDEGLINRSSYTTSNDTNVYIQRTGPGDLFVGVLVSSSIASGAVTLWDSSGTANNKLAVISMQGTGNGAFYIPFEVRVTSGITYSTSGNASPGITIIYKITRPIIQ